MNSPAPDYRPRLQRHDFENADQLAQALARQVAADLRAALDARGQACVALSGGTTPLRFLQALSQQPLDWSRLQVTLVDERWVPAEHPRSNAGLIRQHLLQGPAAAATLLPLYRPVGQPEDALTAVAASLPPRLDVAVLGMGTDGHTASFFPGGDHLAEALDPASTATLLPMRAEGAGEPRITLTLPVLLTAGHLYLHIEGAQKQAVLAAAATGEGAGADYPIRQVLACLPAPLATFWCA
ncbi:6-phosphogluconolactonase [Pseudoxanthomonas dokdonensis]|uniref:6-phosphogluconolactonase n=1 Tax=Pseudoxanthomonas dokdonensis TaxID=344882 RepID=UPI001FE0CE75|nr:6-phosphogluconolactonase [Pseudoxanthomonas dokdonensis]